MKNKDKKKPSKHSQLEDFEFEVLWDAERNLWVTDLVKGKYLLNIKAPGHPEFNTYIKVKKGKRDFEIVVPQNSASNFSVKINAIDVVKGKAVKNVFI